MSRPPLKKPTSVKYRGHSTCHGGSPSWGSVAKKTTRREAERGGSWLSGAVAAARQGAGGAGDGQRSPRGSSDQIPLGALASRAMRKTQIPGKGDRHGTPIDLTPVARHATGRDLPPAVPFPPSGGRVLVLGDLSTMAGGPYHASKATASQFRGAEGSDHGSQGPEGSRANPARE